MRAEPAAVNRRGADVTNALSIDVEGFIESNRQSVDIPLRYVDKARERYEIATNVTTLLELLGDFGIRGTFFFLGRIGRDMPDLVRQVADSGHEIGSHSFDHLRVFGMSRAEFREAAERSKRQLEDAAGVAVEGFRAPDFSIVRSSSWALDELVAARYLYDSSIYPIAGHDVYGVSDAQPVIHRHSNGLIEFPLATATVMGRRVPFGGGGYFRLYPLALTSRWIRSLNRAGRPVMFYIHPYEVGPVIPRVTELSPYRRFRHYWGCTSGTRRMRHLLERFRFGPARDVLRSGGWLAV